MAGQLEENITLDLLDKIDIRAGTNKLVENVEKSDRLVKLNG